MEQMVNQFGNPLTLEKLLRKYGDGIIRTTLSQQIINATATQAVTTIANSKTGPNIRKEVAEVKSPTIARVVNTDEELSNDIMRIANRSYNDPPYHAEITSIVNDGEYGLMAIAQPTGQRVLYIEPKMKDLVLRYAWNKIVRGRKLLLREEQAIACLMHQIWHTQQLPVQYLTTTSAEQRTIRESVVEYIARRTYGDFMKRMNPNAVISHADTMLTHGLGYVDQVTRLNSVRIELGIGEQMFLSSLKDLLYTAEKNAYGKALTTIFRTKSSLPRGEFYKTGFSSFDKIWEWVVTGGDKP